jgi:DNA-binding NarL/FixJ family response regulator
MTKRTQVLVIEDNRLVRNGLADLLNAQPDLTVVAAVENANTALLKQTKPDVVLVDATLGNGDSLRLVASIRKTTPATRVIVMDLLPVREDVIEFIRAGASGFLVKDATVDECVKTIRSVAEGADVVPPVLAGTLLSHIADHAVDHSAPQVLHAVRMTNREREIIGLISEGLSNKDIAQRLDIATYTVKSHVHNILEKLALHTRLEIAAHVHNTRHSEPGAAASAS